MQYHRCPLEKAARWQSSGTVSSSHGTPMTHALASAISTVFLFPSQLNAAWKPRPPIDPLRSQRQMELPSSSAERCFLSCSEDGAVFTLRHSGHSPVPLTIPARLVSPLCFLAQCPAPGPDESPRGQTCIFDRGADHLEPAQDKTTLPSSFPALLPAACHTSIHLPLPQHASF